MILAKSNKHVCTIKIFTERRDAEEKEEATEEEAVENESKEKKTPVVITKMRSKLQIKTKERKNGKRKKE
jgi:hypothetical protein